MSVVVSYFTSEVAGLAYSACILTGTAACTSAADACESCTFGPEARLEDARRTTGSLLRIDRTDDAVSPE